MPSLVDGPAGDAYVSTGELPDRELVERLVHEAHDRYRANRDGVISQAYPALASVPVDLFGVCVVGTSGATFAAGHADYEFTIMSVSKPFVFALVCERIGSDLARERLGVNSTGRLLESFDRVYCPPADAVELYTRQCCLRVTARDLAVMGATLADGGVNPVTVERVVDPAVCHYTLAVMLTAGLYDGSALVAKFLSAKLGMDLLISRPARS